MKKIRIFAMGLLAVVALASCYWRPNFSSGGLSMDVSGITPKAVGDVLRVYLIADGLLFSTGGGVPFSAEVPLTATYNEEQKISINGLPVGPKYKAMVGMGQVTGGVFIPRYYGESAQFVVSSNADTPVSVTMNGVPYSGIYSSYSPDLLGRSLLGVVESGSSVYTAEASRVYDIYAYFDTYLYAFTWDTPISYDLAVDADGFGIFSHKINGLSNGFLNGTTYLDTDKGILPFQWGGESWYFDSSLTSALGGSRDIRGSGSFPVPGTEVDYTVFFRREGGLGGAYVLSGSNDPALWTWVNLNVAGVSDMVVSQYNAYFAADGIAFALPPLFLQDSDLAGHRFELPAPASVQSLGFRPAASLPATLSLGTTDGVWQLDGVNENTSPPIVSWATGPTKVAETAGDSIERIAISNYSSTAEAYLSRYYLYIRTIYGIDKIPFFAVVPGRATGMVWGSDGTLYISGTEGLAAIAVAAYWGGSGI